MSQFKDLIDLGNSNLDLDGTNGFAIYAGNTPNVSSFGESAAIIGDVNGGGIADFVVSDTITGTAYVIFGATTDPTNPIAEGFLETLGQSGNVSGFAIIGSLSGDQPGWDVADIGDIDHDGHSDFAISAKSADNSHSNAGSAFVIFGRTTGSVFTTIDVSGLPDVSALTSDDIGFRIDGSLTNTHFGSSVSGLGDVNGDGFDDFIVGENGFDDPDTNDPEGAASIIFGHDGRIPFTNDRTILPGSWRLGQSVSAGGDINGDGINDILIKAYPRDSCAIKMR